MQKERLKYSYETLHELSEIMHEFKSDLTSFIIENDDFYECFTQDIFGVILSDLFLLMMKSAPNYSSLKSLIELSWLASLNTIENIEEYPDC